MSDEGVDDAVKRELDSSIYIQKYTDDAFKKLNRDMVEYNKHAEKILMKSQEVGAFWHRILIIKLAISLPSLVMLEVLS